ncbi:hypothetical protein GPJ56_006487 [Histomonas meleagridis]|uniref:uncharacterized protein n=1 Tax=Histomonas meleagridis TaxID=135588 RepID=UPI0035595B48|nr:hypothetical protein GPJ56_006487 [Histomonas meleagridis]KAH0798856.1 hypothetical protein GO595_008342 [Histomonas meleagridis]
MKYINPTPSIRGRLNEQALSEVTHYVAKLFTKILSTNDQKDICEDLFNSIIPENVFKGIQDNVNSEVTKAALYKLLYKLFDPYRDWLVPALVDQELPKQIIKDSFEGSHRVKVASLRIMKKVLEYGDLEFLSEFIQPSLLCNIIDSIDPGEDDTTTECLDCLINIMKTVIVNHWKHVAQFFNNVDITNLIDDCIESEYNAVKEKAFKLKGEIAAAFYSMSIEESALEE